MCAVGTVCDNLLAIFELHGLTEEKILSRAPIRCAFACRAVVLTDVVENPRVDNSSKSGNSLEPL